MAGRADRRHHVPVLQDRVLDWQQELLRIARLAELPAAARQAVDDAVADFLREDAAVALELAA
jgi:hypothetical protein